MQFTWDENKNQSNINKHKLDFKDAKEIFDNNLIVINDNRKSYGEKRYIGFGYIKFRLMVVAYTERLPDIVRIISFRKANTREEKFYEKCVKNQLG